MRAIRIQFLLSYAAIGSFMPLLAIFLQEGKGLSKPEIGVALALMSSAHLVSPLVLTLLADMRIDSRRILAGAMAIGCVTLALLERSQSHLLSILLVGVYGLALVAVIPLQDGFYFSAAQARRAAGEPVPEYPHVRVWGTIGFIIPSVLLFFLLRSGIAISVIVWCTIAALVLTIANTFTLPALPAARARPAGSRRALPSLDAARALFHGRAKWFCLALGSAHAASAAFFAYFALYLTEVTGADPSWVGLIINYGVFLEIFFTLATPWMLRRFGMRKVLLAGFTVMAGRMLVLASTESTGIAVLTMTFHGLEIMALYVVPVIYLNSLAHDRFRNSIQGVYTMTISGLAKVITYPIAGLIAAQSLPALFLFGTCLAVIALLVILVGFPEPTHPESRVTRSDEPPHPADPDAPLTPRDPGRRAEPSPRG